MDDFRILPEKRRQEILRLNEEYQGVSIKELAKYFNISSMTILRDIRELQKQNKIKVVRGGIIPLVEKKIDFTMLSSFYTQKKKKYLAEKYVLGEYCVKNFIKHGSTIALEGGTTVATIVMFLNRSHKVTLLTNGLFTLNEANEKLGLDSKIGSASGILDRDYLSFLGPDSERFFREKRVDSAFFSCVGFDFSTGAMDSNPLDAQIKQAMIANAERRILMIDQSKISLKSLVNITDTNNITDIVTNRSISAEVIEKFNKLQPKLHLA